MNIPMGGSVTLLFSLAITAAERIFAVGYKKTETFCIFYWTHLSACGIIGEHSQIEAVSFS